MNSCACWGVDVRHDQDGERWRLTMVGEWLPKSPICPSSFR